MKRNAPLYRAIIKHSKKKYIPFHMPVHNQGRLFSKKERKDILSLDTTELIDTDNLSEPKGCIKDAQDLFAKAYGADYSFLLTQGATSGVFAMLFYACGRGGKVILDAFCHKSVISALTAYNIEPIFVNRNIIPEFGVADGILYDDIYKAVLANPDAKAIFITTPTAYGIGTHLDKISGLARQYNMLLLIDGAHGAHFPFYPSIELQNSFKGADIWVCSIHKTLGAPTQTAVLNAMSERVDIDKLKASINLIHTTSPSYMLMTMSDLARCRIESIGKDRFRYVEGLLYRFKERVIFNTKCLILKTHDPLRLVINFSNYKITGIDIYQKLMHNYNIALEMADLYNIVAILGVITNKRHLDSLYKALIEILRDVELNKVKQSFNLIPLPEMKLSPYSAYTKERIKVALDSSEGKISADTVCVYPPGIPVLVPGSQITKQHINYITKMLKAGAQVLGIKDNYVFTVSE